MSGLDDQIQWSEDTETRKTLCSYCDAEVEITGYVGAVPGIAAPAAGYAPGETFEIFRPSRERWGRFVLEEHLRPATGTVCQSGLLGPLEAE